MRAFLVSLMSLSAALVMTSSARAVCSSDLQITAPTAGASWSAGSTRQITWTSSHTSGTASIYLYKAGQVYTIIGQVPAAAGSFEWHICTTIGNGSDFSIRIQPPGCGPDERVAGGAFSLTDSLPRPALTVTSPASAANLVADTIHTIRWDAANPNGLVNIYLFKSGQVNTLLGSVPMAAEEFDWQVCSPIGNGNGFSIQIFWLGCGPTLQASSGPFIISGSPPNPTLHLTSPAGGANWAAGTTQNITWTSTNPIGNVGLQLLKNGQYHTSIGSAAMSSGQFAWSICPSIGNGTDYSVLIYPERCGPPIQDVSAAFTISGSGPVPTLDLTYPVGGEQLNIGSQQIITWNSTDPAGQVCALLYDIDAPISIDVGCAPMSDGMLPWTVPAELDIGGMYVLSLASSDCGPQSDLSGPFMIMPPLPDADGDGVPDVDDLCPDTVPGATVDEDGCPPLIPGDYDRDGDVDGDDVAVFTSCGSGPAIPLTGGCESSDFDTDGDVDQADFSVVQRCHTGENVFGDPACAD